MEFLKKRFKRKPSIHRDREDKESEKKFEESFHFVQHPEEICDPPDYNQYQVCGRYDMRANTVDPLNCKEHCGNVDQDGILLMKKRKVEACTAASIPYETVCGDVDNCVMLEGYHYSYDGGSSHIEHDPFISMESLTSVPLIDKISAGEIWDKSEHQRWFMASSNDNQAWSQNNQEDQASRCSVKKEGGDIVMRRTEKRKFCKEPQLEKEMNYGETFSSLGSSSSISSTESATHGSYTLWQGTDKEKGSHSAEDDIYLTPESTLKRHSCSCENVNCGLIVHQASLKRKLVPEFNDFDSNDSIISLDFKVKPKLLSTQFGRPPRKELLDSEKCDASGKEDMLCLVDDGDGVDDTRVHSVGYALTARDANSAGDSEALSNKHDSSDDKTNRGLDTRPFLTASLQSMKNHSEKETLVADSGVGETSSNYLISCEHRHDVLLKRQNMQMAQSEPVHLRNISYVSCVKKETHLEKSNHHTHCDLSQISTENDSDGSKGNSTEGQFGVPHEVSDIVSQQSMENVSCLSGYETCTSTLDGYCIYDSSLDKDKLTRANLYDDSIMTNITPRSCGEVCRKLSQDEHEIHRHGNMSTAKCPMCGNMTTFQHENEADIERFRHFKTMLTSFQGRSITEGKSGSKMSWEVPTRLDLNSSTGGDDPQKDDSHRNGQTNSDKVDAPSRHVERTALPKRILPGVSTNHRHVAETLANNAAAIILLLDHKMCERTWTLSDGGLTERSTSQNLPEGFSYGDEEGEPPRLTEETAGRMDPDLSPKTETKLGHRRSRSFGSSVSRAITDAVNKIEEISHESRNKQFHKLFKFVPEDEGLIVSFSCALVRDILLQGRLYLSENWVCFHSNIFTFETQVQVGMEEIQNITKERTAFVVPNAIGIHTDSHKYVFGSLLSRHSTYKQLVRVWQKRYMLDETTSQDSGSRVDSEREALDADEVATEEGEDADIEEEDTDGLVLLADNQENCLQCEVHAQPRRSDSLERQVPSRKVSSTTQQMKPSKIQFFLAQILSLFQAILAINIFKSLRRHVRHQPFLSFSVLMFLVLSISAAIMSYKILTFPGADEHLFHDTYHELSSLGNVLLSHHQSKHEKVDKLQNKLVHQLKFMVNHESNPPSVGDDELS